MRRESIITACLLCTAAVCAGGEEAAEVRFDLLHNQIVLQVSINGTGPYDFLLDSGTQGTTIDLGLARRVSLPLGTQKKNARGAGGGRADAVDTICAELRVAGVAMTDAPALALDLGKVSRAMGRPIGGVLGSGFLASRVTQVDYFRRRIRTWRHSPFAPSPHPPDTPRRVTVPLRFLHGSALPVFTDCFVNGSRMPVTIDTGSSFGLILFPAAVRKLGLEDLAGGGLPLPGAGYLGKVRLTKGWVRSVRLKSVDLGAIEVAYVESGYGDREDPKRRSGNIGNAVLQDFTLTLDYVNGLMVLEYTAE
jgi:predicted aspartyl protease